MCVQFPESDSSLTKSGCSDSLVFAAADVLRHLVLSERAFWSFVGFGVCARPTSSALGVVVVPLNVNVVDDLPRHWAGRQPRNTSGDAAASAEALSKKS